MSGTIAIVGAGLAGDRAAGTLRKEGFEGRVILIGDETQRPYQRPPLSKEFLGEEMAEESLYLRPAQYYADQAIELWTGVRAPRLTTVARCAMTACCWQLEQSRADCRCQVATWRECSTCAPCMTPAGCAGN
jgi:NAD(P)H-nitrite reductase large subunit